MPEIPEMETYRQLLMDTVAGKTIIGVAVERPKSINTTAEEFQSAVNGQIIDNVSRRAKYLIFHLSGGLYLITHMMLDGRLYYGPSSEPGKLPGTPYIILSFADNSSLYFCGLGLGYLHLATSEGINEVVSGLGAEPLAPEFTLETFLNLFRGRRGAIKPLLIDQKFIAGIGNAYSNESLFAAGILPERPVSGLDEGEMMNLWKAIPGVLREAAQNGGYIEEPYAAWDKLSGGQIPYFRVYDRGGEPCKVCGSLIKETKIGGRWTYFCPVCQK